MNDQIHKAAEAITRADVLFIGAGAGMGVDSGLPDFRGEAGFARAYPPYAKRNLDWLSLAQPHWFQDDPPFAWGFAGHQLNLFRSATPHAGYDILRTWSERKGTKSFVFTTNIDGHFERAGFNSQHIEEVHGSVHWLQCTRNCGIGVYPAAHLQVTVDAETLCASEPLPVCPECGALARPNIVLFYDLAWNEIRQQEQHNRLLAWLEEIHKERIVIIECGAGKAIPTVRSLSEKMVMGLDATLIRINPHDSQVPDGHIALPLGAKGALEAIDELISRTME